LRGEKIGLNWKKIDKCQNASGFSKSFTPREPANKPLHFKNTTTTFRQRKVVRGDILSPSCSPHVERGERSHKRKVTPNRKKTRRGKRKPPKRKRHLRRHGREGPVRQGSPVQAIAKKKKKASLKVASGERDAQRKKTGEKSSGQENTDARSRHPSQVMGGRKQKPRNSKSRRCRGNAHMFTSTRVYEPQHY